MRWPSLFVLLVVSMAAFAGCTGPAVPVTETATTTSLPATGGPVLVLGNATGPDLGQANETKTVSGWPLACPGPALFVTACAVLDPTPERDQEASIAAHPTDPDAAIVTWRVGDDFSDPLIFAAVTADGGATWKTTQLEVPVAEAPLVEGHYAYDSTARFGPDGTAYVLFGGQGTQVAGTRVVSRLTLAASDDLGQTWSYRPFHEMPSYAAGADYPDLAVAPDTGVLHAVAQMYTYAVAGSVAHGIWHWQSGDGGVTWSEPQVLVHNGGNPNVPAPYHYLPRVEAGAGGLVVVTTNGLEDGTFGGYFMRSTDAGVTWSAPELVHAYRSEEGTAINDPAAFAADGTLRFVYGDGDEIIGYEPKGDAWAPVELATLRGNLVWLGAASAPDGTVSVEVRYSGQGSEGKEGFGVSALLWHPDGRVQGATFNFVPRASGAWKVGDDYAAVAVGPDGSSWFAWPGPPTSAGYILVARRAAVT